MAMADENARHCKQTVADQALVAATIAEDLDSIVCAIKNHSEYGSPDMVHSPWQNSSLLCCV